MHSELHNNTQYAAYDICNNESGLDYIRLYPTQSQNTRCDLFCGGRTCGVSLRPACEHGPRPAQRFPVSSAWRCHSRTVTPSSPPTRGRPGPGQPGALPSGGAFPNSDTLWRQEAMAAVSCEPPSPAQTSPQTWGNSGEGDHPSWTRNLRVRVNPGMLPAPPECGA